MSSGWGRSTWGAGNWGQPAIQSVSFTLTGLAGTSAVGTPVASIPKSVTLTGSNFYWFSRDNNTRL